MLNFFVGFVDFFAMPLLYAGSVNEKEIAHPDAATDRPRVTVADLRKFADAVHDLDDPAVMARAWQ